FLALVLCGLFLLSLVPQGSRVSDLGNEAGVWERGGAVALLLPAIVLLADGIALQSIGLALGTIRGRRWKWNHHRGIFWRQLRVALALGVTCGLIGAAAGYLWGASWRFVAPVTIPLLVSLAGAPLVSLTVPLILQRSRLTTSLSCGILARASASIAAAFVYLVLAR